MLRTMIVEFWLHAQDGVDFITMVTNIAPGYDHNTATIGNKYRENHKTSIIRYQEAKVLVSWLRCIMLYLLLMIM